MKWAIPALAITLAGCASTPTVTEVEKKVTDTLVTVCLGVDVAWAGFELYKAKNDVKPATALKVAGAYSAAKAVCANPPADTPQAIASVVRAYNAFNDTIKAAKSWSGQT